MHVCYTPNDAYSLLFLIPRTNGLVKAAMVCKILAWIKPIYLDKRYSKCQYVRRHVWDRFSITISTQHILQFHLEQRCQLPWSSVGSVLRYTQIFSGKLWWPITSNVRSQAEKNKNVMILKTRWTNGQHCIIGNLGTRKKLKNVVEFLPGLPSPLLLPGCLLFYKVNMCKASLFFSVLPLQSITCSQDSHPKWNFTVQHLFLSRFLCYPQCLSNCSVTITSKSAVCFFNSAAQLDLWMALN